MPNQPRQPHGVSTGGQYTTKTHAEADVTLDVGDVGSAPPWGRDLNATFDEAVGTWMFDNPEGDETSVVDLVGLDEASAIGLYGEARGRWLGSLRIRNTVESSRVSDDSWDGPGEFWDEGTVEIFLTDDDGVEHVVGSAEWNSDFDVPDLGYLCRKCDVGEDGEPLFDRGHIDWANEVLGRGGAGPWAKHGFRDPNEAVAWAEAGFKPYEAEQWDEADFEPAEAANYVVDGFTPGRARRERAIKFAAELADAEAALGSDAPVSQPGAA